jgi:hypothetical protein
MQVTNVNDVKVYNLTCGQKAVPEVSYVNLLDVIRIDLFSSGLMMRKERN